MFFLVARPQRLSGHIFLGFLFPSLKKSSFFLVAKPSPLRHHLLVAGQLKKNLFAASLTNVL